MGFIKRHLTLVVAGLVIVGGAAYVAARQVAPTADQLVLTQDATTESSALGAPGTDGTFPRVVRGEALVHSKDGKGFTTVKMDHGVFDHVDGTTLFMKEDDGTTVEIPTSADTRIGRDGKKAALSDLKSGDHIFALRVKENDSFVTKGIRAISPERFSQFQDRKDGRRQQRRQQFMDRRQQRGPGGPGI